MKRIPSQVLVLLGISGATGLSSVLIGGSKRSAASTLLESAQGRKRTAEKRRDDLTAEIDRLESEENAAGAAWPSDRVARLAAARQQFQSLAADAAATDEVITAQTRIAQVSTSGGSWWMDIISDETGPSFHRLQVVLWTLILGAVFIGRVASIFTMPEFETTLLILMGISNGTYLGFKIPEN